MSHNYTAINSNRLQRAVLKKQPEKKQPDISLPKNWQMSYMYNKTATKIYYQKAVVLKTVTRMPFLV